MGIIAYILLCGYPPFNGNDYEEIKDAVLDGWYSFASKEWRNTSRDARDFIRNLLQIDPSLRMTAEEALHHPWVHNTTKDEEVMASGEEEEVLPKSKIASKEATDALRNRPRKCPLLLIHNCIAKYRQQKQRRIKLSDAGAHQPLRLDNNLNHTTLSSNCVHSNFKI